MKKLFLLALGTLVLAPVASAATFKQRADEVVIRGRGTLFDCSTNALTNAIVKGREGYVCATTRYNQDDTRDFLDIWFSDDAISPWEKGKYFMNTLYYFGSATSEEDGVGVLLFNDERTMIVFRIVSD